MLDIDLFFNGFLVFYMLFIMAQFRLSFFHYFF